MSLNPEEQRQFEGSLVTFREMIPRLWWNIYQGCLQAGFDESQSFNLLQTKILGDASGGIRPNGVSGPNSDKPKED